MEQSESLAAVSVLLLSAYCIGPLLVGIAIYFVATRSKRALARGTAAMAEGRLVEALAAFELCADKLLLKGQAELWLWRLGDAIADLENCVGFNAERYEERCAPFIALATALRNDRDAESWLRRAGPAMPGATPAARLAQGIVWLRRGEYAQALPWFSQVRDLGLRGERLAAALTAWAQTGVDGTPRDLDTSGVLGEGSIENLQQGWPELARFLSQGRVSIAPASAPVPPAG